MKIMIEPVFLYKNRQEPTFVLVLAWAVSFLNLAVFLLCVGCDPPFSGVDVWIRVFPIRIASPPGHDVHSMWYI